MPEPPSAPGGSSAPFFLVGSVRSGTTVLRLLLGHHPEICRCEELEFVAPLLAGRDDWPPLPAYHHFLRHDRGFRMSGYAIDESLSFPELARSFLEQLRAAEGRRIVGATVHEAFDELIRVWPEARFVYLRRDPRDVARSCVQMGWAGNTWGGVGYWLRAEERWQRLRARLPAERWREIHFEDLVGDAEAVLRQLCPFLGASFDPRMLAIESGTTYARPDPALARSWRDAAPARDVQLVETRLGELLRERGYAPSDLPRLQPDRLGLAAIRAGDTWGRLRFTWRRYGFWLWAAGFLTRRLPVRSWRDRVQLRVDAITNQHLK